VLRPTIAQAVTGFPRQEGLSAAVLVAYLPHMLQRTFPAGFIAPCLPTKTDKLPSGDLWLHEIKHDGFRVIARKDGDRVRLYSRPGNDMTRRFPLIAEALTGLCSRSCIIDGEASQAGVPPHGPFATRSGLCIIDMLSSTKDQSSVSIWKSGAWCPSNTIKLI
jgi:ATP dependent DNA ligase domain